MYNCEFPHLDYSIILIAEINISKTSSLMKEISTECGPEISYRQETLNYTEVGQAGFQEGLPERCRKIQRMDGQPGTREEGKGKYSDGGRPCAWCVLGRKLDTPGTGDRSGRFP